MLLQEILSRGRPIPVKTQTREETERQHTNQRNQNNCFSIKDIRLGKYVTTTVKNVVT